MVLARDSIEVNIVEELGDKRLSAMWLKIGARGRRPMYIGAIYREFRYISLNQPDNSETDQQQLERWYLFVEKWKSAARMGDVIVTGDVNIDYAKWGTPDYRVEKLVEKVKTDIETLGFHQMVEGQTRSWNNQVDSLLDHIWMNTPNRMIYYRNIVRTYSDHNLLVMSFRTKDRTPDRHEIVQRNRKSYKSDDYSKKISEINWENFFEIHDTEELNSMFEQKILSVLDSMAPIQINQRRKKFKNWLNDEVKKEMKMRDELRQIAKDSKRMEDWEGYRFQRNKCVKMLSKVKTEYFNKLYTKIENEKDTRSLYNLTYELMNKKNGNTPQSFVSDGKLVRKPKLMANLQVNYYTNKVNNLIRKIPVTNRNPHRFLMDALSTWTGKSAIPIFEFREISLKETSDLISKMSKSSAMGHNKLDSQGIKDAHVHLVRHIRHLINSSLQSGKFARKWKFSKISPRLKNQELDKCSVESYRPVAILSVTSKLVERAAQLQLLNFLETTKQLNDSNHAYRQVFSTTTTLTEIFDGLYEGAEQKMMTSLMAVDQTAAFDTVNHRLLIEKLRLYNIGNRAMEWFEDYLKMRTQYVVLGRAESIMKTINHGVPQGSVIGPLLYAVYVNDLSESIKRPDCRNEIHRDRSKLFGSQCRECGTLISYADDSTYSVGSRKRSDNEKNMKRALNEIQNYLTDNKLFLNKPKTQITEVMIQQKRGKTNGQLPTLTVTNDNGENKIIQDSKYMRVLGSNIAQNMLWKTHLEAGKKALLPQARKTLGLLRHLGNLIPYRSRRNLANGLILSKLSYLMPLWGTAADAHIRKAQVLLNATARWVTGLRKSTKIITLMTAINWMTIKEQIYVSTLLQTWKLVHLERPPRMLESMYIGQNFLIETSRPRLIFTSGCYRWKAARLWNELNIELRETKSISKFKKMIKRKVLEDRELQQPPD